MKSLKGETQGIQTGCAKSQKVQMPKTVFIRFVQRSSIRDSEEVKTQQVENVLANE